MYVDPLGLAGEGGNEQWFNMLNQLHVLTKQYTNDVEQQYLLMFMLLRQYNAGPEGNTGYVTSRWAGIAGKVDTKYIEFIKDQNMILYDFFDENRIINDPITTTQIETTHLFATLGGLLYNTTIKDFGLQGAIPEKHVDNLSGWAGDL